MTNPQRKVFITGGAGFIGSRVAHRFVDNGDLVVVFDSFKQYLIPNPDASQPNLLSRLRDIINNIELVQGDVLNKDFLRRRLLETRPDIIVHMASLPLASVAIEQTEEAFESILSSTTNIMEVMRDFKHDCRLVYISSSMVYGNFEDTQVTEESATNPVDIYGSFKLAGEIIARGYMKRYGLDLTIVRPSAVYGPLDGNQRVLYKFITAAIRGEKLIVDGDGSLRLDFTFVDDTAKGIFLAATSPEASGETFNITRGKAFSLNEAIEVLKTEIGELHLEYRPVPDHIPVRGTLDITKAKYLIGYLPDYNLEKGLRIYINHLKANAL